MEFTIRHAKTSDALFLTSISFGAKRYWNYSDEHLETWHNELTITEQYIEKNTVFVAQKKDTIIGYCSMTEVKEDYWKDGTFIKSGYWLEHIFIRPAYIRSGIGSKLIEELMGYCRENNIKKLNILSDPNVNGFYDKIGAIYIKNVPSKIEGREACLFEFHIPQENMSELEKDELKYKTNELGRSFQESDIEIASISEEELAALLGKSIQVVAENSDEDRVEGLGEEVSVGNIKSSLEEVETDDIFREFRFDRQEFEMGVEDLEKRRMRLEKQVLEQKLHELDRDEDEDEIYEFSAKDYDEEKYYSEEYDIDSILANFQFTTSIGYKFECEEEEEEQEKQEKIEVLEEIDEREEQVLEEEKVDGQTIEVIDSNDETIVDERQELGEAELEESREILEEPAQVLEDIEAILYESEEETVRDIQSVAEAVEEYSIVEREDLYDRSEEEESYFEEAQQIVERTVDEVQGKQLANHLQENQTLDNQSIHIKTEKEKMLEGEQYIAWGDEIVSDRRRARRILKEFNLVDPEDKKQSLSLLKELFGSTGEYIHIEPDFKCNYGYNIHIGDNFYADYNCVILDNAKVTIGDNCIISPQVGIYTLAYPIDAKKRIAGYEYAYPITIGNNVWIGGGAVINAGVTIGNDVVILPGSVITSDIPDGVIAGGNPTRIIKEIDE